MTNITDALRQNATLVTFTGHGWTAEKTNRRASQETIDANNARGNAGKFVMDLLANNRAKLKAVNDTISAARNRHKLLTSVWGDVNWRLLVNPMFFKYTKEMKKQKDFVFEAREDLVSNWDELVANARSDLGNLDDGIVYPTAEQVRNKFSFNLTFQPIPQAADFRFCKSTNVDSRLWNSVVKRIERQAIKNEQSAYDGAIKEAVERVKVPMSRLLAQLEKDEGARFRTNTLEQITSNVTLARALNVMGNAEIEDWCSQVEQSVAGLTTADLKKSETTRQSVATEMRGLLGLARQVAAE